MIVEHLEPGVGVERRDVDHQLVEIGGDAGECDAEVRSGVGVIRRRFGGVPGGSAAACVGLGDRVETNPLTLGQNAGTNGGQGFQGFSNQPPLG